MFIFLACVFFLADSLTDKSQLLITVRRKGKERCRRRTNPRRMISIFSCACLLTEDAKNEITSWWTDHWIQTRWYWYTIGKLRYVLCFHLLWNMEFFNAVYIVAWIWCRCENAILSWVAGLYI